ASPLCFSQAGEWIMLRIRNNVPISLSPAAQPTIAPGAPRGGLGRGFLSTLGRPATLLVDPARFETESSFSQQFRVDLVDDRSSSGEEISLSANAKFGFCGGGASFRASMSQSFRKSQRSLVVILTKAVQTEKQFLRNPLWAREPLDLISRDKEAFIQQYG